MLATILFFLSVPSAFANATSTDLRIWPAKTTTEVNKVWTIAFNVPLESTSVNENTIFVTDSKQKKISTMTKLSIDGLSVTVTPSKAYTAGDYNLFITNKLTSLENFKHNEQIIVPFTVIVPTTVKVPSTIVVPTYTGSVSYVVSVTDDYKAVYTSDLSGSLWIEGPNGTRLGPSSKDLSKGQYTYNIYADGDYYLKSFKVANGVITTQTVKLSSVKLPIIKVPITGATTAPKATIKTANFVIATKAGVDGGKSGSIGGRISPAKWGVQVKVSNANTTWTTITDLDGNFEIYLPSGSYQLVVDGNEAQYKKHSYKLTVTAGQKSSPADAINGEEPIGQLGLILGVPVVTRL